MSGTLRRRLDRAEAASGADPQRFEVWYQAHGGADLWTCRTAPGVTLTEAAIDARTASYGDHVTVIYVSRVDLGPGEMRP